jgi:hypothetical protein
MYPPDEFLKHADDCQRMAKVARDPTTKARWRQMSQRWVQCAERPRTRMPLRTMPPGRDDIG